MKKCRICAGSVIDPEIGWIDLPHLGRFWVCARCREDATYTWTYEVGYIFFGKYVPRLVLGPYPYGPSMICGTQNVTSVAADSDDPKNGGSKPEER